MTDRKPDLLAAATEIAAAYVSRNHVAAPDLTGLIVRLHETLSGLAKQPAPQSVRADESPKPTPAEVRRSITPHALVSFIDGKPYRSLKRHLTGHGLNALSYRQKYDLPYDYPMVAPSYSERRSELAKAHAFGKANKGRARKA